MILPRLVDAGGGSSRLGGLVQRGLGLFRKAFVKKTPAEPNQGLLVQQLRSRPIVPPEPILATVRRGAREILSTYLARNQIQTVAAEMRRRYAFRLMSGPVGFTPGLRSRIAIYGFVGLSFGNAVCNRDNQQPLEDSHTVQGFKELFSPRHSDELVSKKVEEDTFSVLEYNSISADSDTTVRSDEESDFEILETSGVLIIAEENDCVSQSDSIVYDKVLELKEVFELENKQRAEIWSLTRNLIQENEVLRDIINKLGQENKGLKDIINKQEQEKRGLKDIINKQGQENKGLKDIINKQEQENRGLKDIINTQEQENKGLKDIINKQGQENRGLKDIINTQENLFKTELTNILTSSTEQQKELLKLRGLEARKKAALKTLCNQRRSKQATGHSCKAEGQNPKSNGIPADMDWDMVCENECRGSVDGNSLENEREKLRAAGGRTRALKIHRKLRFKKNRIRFMIRWMSSGALIHLVANS